MGKRQRHREKRRQAKRNKPVVRTTDATVLAFNEAITVVEEELQVTKAKTHQALRLEGELAGLKRGFAIATGLGYP